MRSERVGATMTGSESENAPDSPVENVLNSLSPRERQVLGLMAHGYSNKTIAGELVINEKPVEIYVSHIFPKLGISSKDPEVNGRVKSVLIYQINTPDFNNLSRTIFTIVRLCHLLQGRNR